MSNLLPHLESLLHPSLETALHWCDILLVTYVIFRVLMLIRGTRAWRIMFGLGGFVLLLLISKALHLDTLNWILDKATLLGPVALVILFLPELRQTLETFGKFSQKLGVGEPKSEVRTIEELVSATTELAAASVGALIIVEREAQLEDIVGNGVRLDAKVSAPLLGAIFYEGNPLHDGAVIVRDETILSAASRLPLSESSRLDQNVHMRHRAAVGVTETFDCIAIVVSEERGSISVAIDGRLRRLANHLELREILNRELRGIEQKPRRDRSRLSLHSRRNRETPSEPVKP